MSLRCKTDVFLMFHFKIITMDLFLKRYIKLKLFWVIASTRRIHLETSCLRCWCVAHMSQSAVMGHWGHIIQCIFSCKLWRILFPSVSRSDRTSSYNTDLYLNPLASPNGQLLTSCHKFVISVHVQMFAQRFAYYIDVPIIIILKQENNQPQSVP